MAKTLLQHIAEMATTAKLLSPFLAWPTVLTVALMLQCCVCLSSSVCNVMYCGKTVHLRAKVTIDSLQEVVYED